MWCTWATTLLLVTCALVTAEDPGAAPTETTRAPLHDSNSSASRHTEKSNENLASIKQTKNSTVVDIHLALATTRAPLRTLDRLGDELAWKSWLQSPESVNQNAPPRRITTKSLFITPLVCPKGQRLDRNGCVQTVTVDKDEHERILLEQLNALFSSPSTGDVLYDYDDEDRGPLQLSLPIGLDPQAIPLQSQEPSAQTVSESARVKISTTRVDSKNERGEWRLWRAPRAVRSGWRPEARPGRAARPPSPRVASSDRLRVSPNLPDDRTSEPREKEIILVVGFLSDG
ncbi:hypothetical protein ACJJTC_013031 [Scirpophaga incertulas]